ncbi:hypothetical protein [Chitinophaga sp. HK235]|uniref:hypothetical protein n=1 Tax=Chitinophaga sp. HK235 TaxID=2952571 RepID=UPI001BA59A5D|nr:hypothetical protein [Chitinophaga sp. HK235]
MIHKSELLPGSLVCNSDHKIIEWSEQLSHEIPLIPVEISSTWIRRLGFGTLDYIHFIAHPYDGDEFVIKLSSDKSTCILLVPEQEGEVYPRFYKETAETCKFIHELQKLYHLKTGELLELQYRFEDE